MRAIYVSLSVLLVVSAAAAELKPHDITGYVSQHELTLPGSPEDIYDAMTGEIGDWWDHKFSENPISFRIEPRPGGKFLEIFDEAGNGVQHGEVIWAQRGKRLTFEGPLGFNGYSYHLAATWQYEAAGEDSTKLTAVIRFHGQISEEEAAAIDGVWKYFLVDRLKPHIESGAHR